MRFFGMEIRRVPKVAERAAKEIWVTAEGKRVQIGEMEEAHAKHSLAMVVRNVRAGRPVFMLSNGQLYFGYDLDEAEVRLQLAEDLELALGADFR